MAQTGFTPILIYGSGTTGNTPSAGNLTSSSAGAELAINYFDGKLFYKDNAGVVQTLATKGTAAIGGSNTQVQYNNAGALAGSANLTFNGTTLTANALTVSGTTTLSALTASTALALNGSKEVVSVTNTGTGNNVLATSPTLTTPNLGTPSALTLTNATGLPLSTGVTGTLATTNGGTGLTSFTANGVVYASSTSALTTGSALTFDGTNLSVGAALGARLSVDQPAAATAAQFRIAGIANLIVGSAGGSDNFYDANNQIFRTGGGSELMRLTSTGLGIGTSSFSRRLTVNDATTSYIGHQVAGSEKWVAGVDTSNRYILFDSTAATNRLTIDTSGNLGIGTSSPSYRLDISGTSATARLNATSNSGYAFLSLTGTGRSYEIGVGGSTTGAPYQNNLYFVDNTASSVRMVLDSSGNLGLGVTPSAWTIKASQVLTSSLSSDGNDAYLTANGFFDGSWKYVASDFAAQYYQVNGAHAWRTAPSGTAGNAISFTQAMTLDASGRLGIGMTSPVARLDVYGDIATSNGSGGRLLLRETDPTRENSLTCGADVNGSYLNASFSTGGTAVLRFQTANQERARITSGGDLLVGTTGSLVSAVSRFRVSAGAAPAIDAKNTSATDAVVDEWNSATSGDNQFERFWTEGTATQRGSIDYNRAGGLVRYNTTSDYRAKDIIGPVENSGAVIDALKVYTGKMKGATQERPMLIAHEAQEHAPYAVGGVKDEMNEDGTPKFQQMDHASMVPLLIAELQSLRARVAQLERQLQ